MLGQPTPATSSRVGRRTSAPLKRPKGEGERAMLPTTLSHPVTSPDVLAEIIGAPDLPAVKKQINFLDDHCRRFIALSPLLFIASSNGDGLCDVSPKGDPPPFLPALTEPPLAIPHPPRNR